MKPPYISFIATILLTCFTLTTQTAKAFSVLAHEAIVDAEWDIGIKPLLNQKFPNITGPEYRTAHAYAYGGCLMADMGYMPGGNAVFTDLLHYVRSGDFVMNLLNEAHTLNEYAFALGALSHYMADKYGHSLATNKTVPIVFPELRQKFGNTVTYDEDHSSHSQIEFTYDVLQISRGNYASNSYHDFIGFAMPVPLLEKVFKLTYGQDLSEYFKNINSSINTYRWAIRSVFPRFIRNASKAHKDEIAQINMTPTSRLFKYRMTRHMFNLEYGKKKHTKNFVARALASIVRILPKVGPLKSLKFVDPTPAGEKLFDDSFKTIVEKYNTELKQLSTQPLQLADINFDTGQQTKLGEYRLTDETYNKLVISLKENNYHYLTPELKRHIIEFYHPATAATFAQLKPKEKKKLMLALKEVKKADAVSASSLAADSTSTGQ